MTKGVHAYYGAGSFLTVWHLLTLLFAALFTLFAFVLAAELDDGDGKKDSQDAETHGNPNCC